MDLTTPQQGAFDSSFRFSDFYVWAMQQAFTGALDVNTRFGVRSIGFREGSPIWVEGVAEDSDRLGALLVSQGHAAAADVDAALRVKAASPELLSEPAPSPPSPDRRWCGPARCAG